MGSSGFTPLMYASLEGHVEAVRILLDARANIEAQEEDGMRALHCAALQENLGACQLLVERRADPQSKDHEQKTPLEYLPVFNEFVENIQRINNNQPDGEELTLVHSRDG